MNDKTIQQTARKNFKNRLARYKKLKEISTRLNLSKSENLYWGMLNDILYDYLLSRGIERDKRHFNTYSVRQLQKRGFFWSRSLNRILYNLNRDSGI